MTIQQPEVTIQQPEVTIQQPEVTIQQPEVTIQSLRTIFAQHGLPEGEMPHYGSCFTAEESKKCKN